MTTAHPSAAGTSSPRLWELQLCPKELLRLLAMDIGDQRPSHRRSANNGNMVKYKLLLTGPWAFWFVISEAFRLTRRPCGVPLASDEAFFLQAGAVGCGEEADRLRAGPCIPGTPREPGQAERKTTGTHTWLPVGCLRLPWLQKNDFSVFCHRRGTF